MFFCAFYSKRRFFFFNWFSLCLSFLMTDWCRLLVISCPHQCCLLISGMFIWKKLPKGNKIKLTQWHFLSSTSSLIANFSLKIQQNITKLKRCQFFLIMILFTQNSFNKIIFCSSTYFWLRVNIVCSYLWLMTKSLTLSKTRFYIKFTKQQFFFFS